MRSKPYLVLYKVGLTFASRDELSCSEFSLQNEVHLWACNTQTHKLSDHLYF